MTLEIKHKLGLSDLHNDALNIRKTVFVDEQGVSLEDELDDQLAEAQAIHIVAYIDTTPVATARVREEQPGIWHVQRVATLSQWRHHGLGQALFDYIISMAPKFNIHQLYLGAQVQAKGFYTRLGFQSTGEPFMEAGISHINMFKELN